MREIVLIIVLVFLSVLCSFILAGERLVQEQEYRDHLERSESGEGFPS